MANGEVDVAESYYVGEVFVYYIVLLAVSLGSSDQMYPRHRRSSKEGCVYGFYVFVYRSRSWSPDTVGIEANPASPISRKSAVPATARPRSGGFLRGHKRITNHSQGAATSFTSLARNRLPLLRKRCISTPFPPQSPSNPVRAEVHRS